MKYTVKTTNFANTPTDCLVLGVYIGSKFTPSATATDRATKGLLTKLSKQGDISGACGNTLMVPTNDLIPAKRLLIFGLGDPKTLDSEEFSNILKVVDSIMFTGLIQSIGTIKKHSIGVIVDGCKPFSPIKLGDSVCVDGVCLTVSQLMNDSFLANVSEETLQRTTLAEKSQKMV